MVSCDIWCQILFRIVGLAKEMVKFSKCRGKEENKNV